MKNKVNEPKEVRAIIKIRRLVFCLMLLPSLVSFAAETPDLEEKLTDLGLYVTAEEAYEMKLIANEDVLFVDVRTRAELAFLGMTNMVDVNIPYMLAGDWDEWDDSKNNFKFFPNSNFLPYFEEYINAHHYTKNSKIILICRSGNRSAAAANLLAKVKYTRVYSVVDGFEGNKSTQTDNNQGGRTVNGWKNKGLPWSYQLDEGKMYMEF